MTESFFFYAFGATAVVMMLLVILLNNPVASALSLVMALFCLSGLYILLEAPFVAVLQVLVYAGAVMVLFVFVIMLLKLRPEDLQQDRVTIGKAGVVLLGVPFVGFLIHKFLSVPVESSFKPVAANFGSPKEVGTLMFTKYLIPFEVVSILLLVAIIGVIVLAYRSPTDRD